MPQLLNNLLIFLILLRSTFATICYHPDGTSVDGTIYKPCSTNTTYSMCCATGDRGTSYPDDSCLPNGLCFNPCLQDANMTCDGAQGAGTYWRESCTDPTWSSPQCLKSLCANSTVENGSDSDDVVLTMCPIDGKWCCGSLSARECCANSERIAIKAKLYETTTSSTTSTTSTTTSSTKSSTSASSTGKTQATLSTLSFDEEKDAIGKETRNTGLGVGIGLGIPLLISVAGLGWLLYSKRQTGSVQNSGYVEASQAPRSPEELSAATTISEMYVAGHGASHEMDGWNHKPTETLQAV